MHRHSERIGEGGLAPGEAVECPNERADLRSLFHIATTYVKLAQDAREYLNDGTS